MERGEFIQGLRELAAFYEQREDFPLPCSETFNVFLYNEDENVIRAEMAQYARQMAPAEKAVVGDWFVIRRAFGGVTLEINASRNKVCTPRVVRVEHVPERVEVVPAHDTEVIEWDCPGSLLEAK